MNPVSPRCQTWAKATVKWLLPIWIFLAAAPGAQAQTVTGTYNGVLVYSASNSQVIITSYTSSLSGSLSIPATIKVSGSNLPVTSIGRLAFSWCGLTSVTIPSSVTSIGSLAFSWCSGLTSVTIPSSVTSIGSQAFDGCSGLTSVTIPSSVNSIGDGVCAFCTKLVSISVDTGNPNYCSVNNVLFDKLQTNLIQFPPGVSGTYAIPSSVTSVGPQAFGDCSGLTSVTIPSTVTSIGIEAFDGCSGLTSVTIPDSVTTIGIGAFGGCSGLTSVTIPNSVTNIGIGAFGGCSGLTSVTIPNSVTNIGIGAFGGCSGLTSVTIPNSVTNIGIGAFGGCSGLTSVTIPNSVTNIGIGAFGGCSGLTSVLIPSSVISIGYDSFGGCSGLTSIVVDASNSAYCSVNEFLFDKAQATLIQVPGKFVGGYTIPSSVTTIGIGAFDGCSGLTGVTIPGSVTSIGNGAFDDCSSLTSVTIPSSVTSIGNQAFYGCAGMTKAVFQGNAPTMGSSVFGLTASGFTINYCTDKTGFTTPSWNGYPCVSIGYSSPAMTWLVSKGFSFNADLSCSPNHDGVPLLMSYALNLDPRTNQSRNLPTPFVSGSNLCLKYYGSNSDVSYQVQTSTDLKNWTATGVTLSGTDASGNCTATIPLTGTRQFMRLMVTH